MSGRLLFIVICSSMMVIGVRAQVTDIRRVDFLNFTYHSTDCSEAFQQPKTIRVRNGRFKDRDFYYDVRDRRVIYGDVSDDGRQDAVVPIICGSTNGNFTDTELFVYSLQEGRPKLLASTGSGRMEDDYKRYFPNGFIVAAKKNGVRVHAGHLLIYVYADGSNAAPKYLVTLNYRLRGGRLVITGKPARRPSGI
jgi:hypothetical protein